MYNSSKKSKNTLLTLIVALMLSLVMVFSTACGNNDDNDSDDDTKEETSQAVDYQTLQNGDFEYKTDSTAVKDFPVSSSINWTRASASDYGTSSAPSSTYKSGIIDTAATRKNKDDKDEEVYSVIAKTIGLYDNDTSAVTFNPKTPYDYDLIDSTHEVEDGDTKEGSKILAICNAYTNSTTDLKGTAQHFTSSSSITLAKDQYAEVSLWVLTHDLTNPTKSEDFGAYVALNTTLGSKTKSPFVLKNINTNDEWAKVTFYIIGSDYATTSFKLELGLGRGSKDIIGEYVQGYAFFDDVHVTVYDNKDDFDEVCPADTDFNYIEEFYSFDGTVFEERDKDNFVKSVKASIDSYKDNSGDADKYTAINAKYDLSRTYETFPLSATTIPVKDGMYTKADTEGNYGKYAQAGITTSGTTVDEVEIPANSIYFVNKKHDGKLYPASFEYEFKDTAVDADKYLMFSFKAKSSLANVAATGLSIDLIDYGTDDTFTTKDTVTTSLTSDLCTNNVTDNDGYVKFTTVVYNTYGDGEMRFFSIKFSFGPTTATDNYNLFPDGYAIIKDLEYTYLADGESSQFASGDYVKTGIALYADMTSSTKPEDSENVYNFDCSVVDKASIDQQPAPDANNYVGVVGNSSMVGGDLTNSSGDKMTLVRQEGTIAGVAKIGTDTLDNYETNGVITSEQKTALLSWMANVDFGDNTHIQTLFINNTATAEKSYGFVQKSASTFSAGTTTKVTVKVFVLGTDAFATVYLVDATDGSTFSVLSADYNDGTNNVSKKMQTTVTPAMCKSTEDDGVAFGGWVEVTFFVTTGNEDKSYRVEVWNGTRNNSTNSTGIVIVGEISTTTVSNIDSEKEKLALDYTDITDFAIDFSAAEKLSATQTIKTDSYPDGYTKQIDTDVYYSNNVVTFIDYNAIDYEEVVDNTTAKEEDTDEETDNDKTNTNDTSYDAGLYVTTLVIAIALLVALVAILVRNIAKKRKSNKKDTRTYYSRDSRAKIYEKAHASKTSNVQLADENETAGDYDYENMENNLVEEQPTEETTEQPATEETVEETAEETTEQPTTEEVVEQPTAEQPAVEQPATEEVAEQPATETATEETTEQSTTETATDDKQE